MKESKSDELKATLFIFYRCDAEHCRKKYAVEEEATEEPMCPSCGSYYFEHLADHSIKI